MRGYKKKGRGNGSPKKTESKTRSQIKKDWQKDLSDSLTSVFSPVKTWGARNPKNPKKLQTVSEDLKQASIDLPEHKKGTAPIESLERGQEAISPVIVTETKQKYKSSEYKNSTKSESNLLVPQAKMSPPFDNKFEQLINTYLYVKSDKYEIWQTFVENDIYPMVSLLILIIFRA